MHNGPLSLLICWIGLKLGGEQLGQVGALDVGELVELGAAREAVGEHGRVLPGGADRGEQRGLGDRRRDVVVPALDTEVARQAAAAHRADLGARRYN